MINKKISNENNEDWDSYIVTAEKNLNELNFTATTDIEFNSDTLLSVGDFILVDNVLARVKSVIRDDLNTHTFTIAYAHEDLGTETIVHKFVSVDNISLTPDINGECSFKTTTNEFDLVRTFNCISYPNIKNIKNIAVVDNTNFASSTSLALGDLISIENSYFGEITNIDTYLIDKGDLVNPLTKIDDDAYSNNRNIEPNIVASNLQGNSSVDGLFDRVQTDSINENSAYWASTSNYVTLSIDSEFRIWRSGTTSWSDHNQILQIDKLNDDGNFEPVTGAHLDISPITETEWEIFTTELEPGTYKFHGATNRVDSEWFIEKLERDLSTRRSLYTFKYINKVLPTTPNDSVSFIDLPSDNLVLMNPDSVKIKSFSLGTLERSYHNLETDETISKILTPQDITIDENLKISYDSFEKISTDMISFTTSDIKEVVITEINKLEEL